MPVRFEGDFNLWSWVERCKALYAFVRHDGGERDHVKAVSAEIRAAGYVEERRRGLLSHAPKGHRSRFRAALAEEDRPSLLAWGIPYASELVLSWVMGGSLRLSRRRLRSELDQVVAELRDRPPAR